MSYLDTTSDDTRTRDRGLEIAARFSITRDGDLWVVPHPTSRSFHYRVALHDDLAECRCTCPEFAETWRPCCHIHAARYAQMRDSGRPVPTPDYSTVVPAGAPKWVTPELIRETLRVWQVYYPERLTVDDALTMLVAISSLGDPGPK